MKVKHVLLLSVLTCMFVLAGCQKTESTSTEEKPQVVTMLLQQSRNFPGLNLMIEKLKTEENITVDVQVVPDDEAVNMIKMKLNSGESPDLIDFNIPAIYDIINPERNFADLSAEPWVQNLVIPANVTAQDGKIYGFPFLSVPGVHGFIYNKDIFAECGIAVPKNWNELLAACETLKSKGDVPIFMPKDSWVPQILMTDNFVKALGTDGVKTFKEKVMRNEAKWNEVPEFVTVLDNYLDLFKKGYVNDNYTSATYDDAIVAVANGKAAMHFNGDFFASSVIQANPNANIGMFTVSMIDGVDTVSQNMSSAGFVVYKNSKNLETVKKILNLWSTPEYANLYFADRPAFPAFKGVDGGPVPSYLTEINETYIKSGNTVPEFNYYVMDLNPLFESTLYIYYTDAPAKGNYSGKAILDKFQKDFEQYMKDMGKENF